MFLSKEDRENLKNDIIEIPEEVFDCFDKEFFVSFGKNLAQLYPKDKNISLGNDLFSLEAFEGLESTIVFGNALLATMESKDRYSPILEFYHNEEVFIDYKQSDMFDFVLNTIGKMKGIFV